ncbi:unnamed protein product [Citrullus colocynthis]|uniref:Uncharacterized protein n=1 Tax=Citrullus colocynthis TaxID=252529 RepID=A0ABP0YCC3_9ROSI
MEFLEIENNPLLPTWFALAAPQSRSLTQGAWRFPHEKQQKVWEWRWPLEAAISMPVNHILCSPTQSLLKFQRFLMELPSINLHLRLLLLLLPLIFPTTHFGFDQLPRV